MKSINALIAVSLASAVTGWITGQAWILGSRAAEQGLWWLVVLAVPSNLAIAALHYYLLRGAVHHSGGGIGLYVVLAAVNLAISVGVASMAADAIGAGNSAKNRCARIFVGDLLRLRPGVSRREARNLAARMNPDSHAAY
jgi:hypothetical protein